ncbi:unnamed protein product [Periconia digitata]|uniref:Uncharacterized protein n=1 Tax=Periconia digitata TaxID=1303443 RepID=A0A9W4US03_9PLEO|nr:unnamed protein product [Periconia digitata]
MHAAELPTSANPWPKDLAVKQCTRPHNSGVCLPMCASLFFFFLSLSLCACRCTMQQQYAVRAPTAVSCTKPSPRPLFSPPPPTSSAHLASPSPLHQRCFQSTRHTDRPPLVASYLEQPNLSFPSSSRQMERLMSSYAAVTHRFFARTFSLPPLPLSPDRPVVHIPPRCWVCRACLSGPPPPPSTLAALRLLTGREGGGFFFGSFFFFLPASLSLFLI